MNQGKSFSKIGLFSALIGGMALAPLADAGADSLEERVAKLEKQAMSSGGGGFPSWFSLGGELELEYKDAQQDPNLAATNSHARWDLDKFVLKIGAKLSDNLKIHNEVEFNEATGSAYWEEGYAQFSGLPGGTWMKVGGFERFTKSGGKFDMAKKITESYPMAGTSNWRDDMFQIQFGGKHDMGGTLKDVFWRAHVGDGLELNDKGIGEDDGSGKRSEIVHDNDYANDTAQVGQKIEWGVGFGMTFKPSDDYTFDVAAWHMVSELNDDEKAFLFGTTGFMADRHLAAAATDGNADFSLSRMAIDDTQTRSGIRSTHKMGDTTVTWEAWESVDARWRRNGWYIDAYHKIKLADPLIADEFINSITPNLRYEEYDSNIANTYADPQTWDRSQMVYALIIGITSNKNLKSTLKLEYLDNWERTGHSAGPITGPQHTNPSRIKNDEFLGQLEFKF